MVPSATIAAATSNDSGPRLSEPVFPVPVFGWTVEGTRAFALLPVFNWRTDGIVLIVLRSRTVCCWGTMAAGNLTANRTVDF